MLQQCFDSALTAKSLAQSMKSGAVAPLSIALSVTINIMLLVSFLSELVRALPGLELRFYRGTNEEIAELLKKGEADVAVAGPMEGAWDRLDSWPLFTEPYRLVVGNDHRLAKANGAVSPSELVKERFLCRSNCEHVEEITAFLEARNAKPATKHNLWTEQDLVALLELNFGVGIAPRSSALSLKSKQLDVDGLTIERTVYVYGVAGRQRSMAASTLIKMLRAADWRVVENQLLSTSAPPEKAASELAT
jgi:DNA-binding transcriptional LysR family regulator